MRIALPHLAGLPFEEVCRLALPRTKRLPKARSAGSGWQRRGGIRWPTNRAILIDYSVT